MTRGTRALRRSCALMLAALVVAGCGATGGGAAAMNMQEAAERADSMLDATIKAVVPEIQWTHDSTTASSCEVWRRRTVLTIISDARRGNFLGVVERHWKKSGYRISAVRKSADVPAVFAQSADGFQITLEFGHKGQAFFEVATPCVEESAVADPASQPNGPAYAPGEIPTPNVRSDFWSATGPAVPPAGQPSSSS
ncbi:hypothetical protein BJP39_02620 [Streptomyces sp. CC77]|nr:hypothetical protein BJP39_02620 [Streptomyces sp. CC77]